MAARLQHLAPTFTHWLVDTSRLRRPIFTATVPRRCAMRRLRAFARCSEYTGSQPPNSTCYWMKNGATSPRRDYAGRRWSVVVARFSNS